MRLTDERALLKRQDLDNGSFNLTGQVNWRENFNLGVNKSTIVSAD